jgi:hypothetical protein
MDDEYSTALAAEAMATSARASDREFVDGAVRWTLGRAKTSSFVTAWSVRTMSLLGDSAQVREPLARAVAWLLEHQGSDGSWSGSARMLAPRPDMCDHDGGNVPHLASEDVARVFTTATVLSALAHVPEAQQ